EPDRFRESQLAWELLVEGDRKLPVDVREALAVDLAKRNEAQKKVLRDYYLRKVYAGARSVFEDLEADLAEVQKRIRNIDAAIPHGMISEELEKPRTAHLLIRGDFLQKGEKVDRGVPAVFPPLPKGEPNNRLGLARWLVSKEHP